MRIPPSFTTGVVNADFARRSHPRIVAPIRFVAARGRGPRSLWVLPKTFEKTMTKTELSREGDLVFRGNVKDQSLSADMMSLKSRFQNVSLFI
jgi:hypothetical protein